MDIFVASVPRNSASEGDDRPATVGAIEGLSPDRLRRLPRTGASIKTNEANRPSSAKLHVNIMRVVSTEGLCGSVRTEGAIKVATNRKSQSAIFVRNVRSRIG
jgi:hypothetical protein